MKLHRKFLVSYKISNGIVYIEICRKKAIYYIAILIEVLFLKTFLWKIIILHEILYENLEFIWTITWNLWLGISYERASRSTILLLEVANTLSSDIRVTQCILHRQRSRTSYLLVICYIGLWFNSTWTQWPPFRRRQLQMQFHEWKVVHFYSNFTEVSFYGPGWQ